jgi:lysophospholipase L1-like esterase
MTRLSLAVLLISTVAAAAPIRTAGVMCGTSLTYGYTQDATPITARLATLEGVPVVNMGVGGDVASNIALRGIRYAVPFAYAFAVWEGCTNDFGLNGALAVDCWATTLTWVAAVEGAGTQAVILTVPPRQGSSGWSAPKETQRLAYNTLARNYGVSHPSAIIVDLETLLGDGATPPALNNTYDYGDDLHLNGAGMQVAAAAIYGARP